MSFKSAMRKTGSKKEWKESGKKFGKEWAGTAGFLVGEALGMKRSKRRKRRRR